MTNDNYAGLCALEATVRLTFIMRDASDTPTNSTALPTYRVYGPSGLMTDGTGTTAFLETGVITGATNATPIVITDVAHGLTTGTRITVVNVGGNTAANGTFIITKLTADTFSLDTSVGNGAYTSGGTWNSAGLYYADVVAQAADGYASGVNFLAIANGTVSVAKAPSCGFTVV